MCRLLCSLLMSLAVIDGAVPHLSCTCQHYSQPLENRLLNHQLKQCIDSQSHRLITYCLHNHVMYMGPGTKNVFRLCSRLLLPFPHQRIQTLGGIPTPWHCHHAPAPPSTPKCYNSEQVSVCQIHGKTYWTGTIIQTNEITEQFCPYKSASACWQYDASYRANSPLDPCLYQVLNATHHLLNDTNPQLARDCWLCLSLGAPQYLAKPVPLNIATAMGTPIDPPLQGPVFFFFNINLFILIGG